MLLIGLAVLVGISGIAFAWARLKPGSLLIMHGMADDNVTFDHTTRVLFALQAAGTPFETMVYPGLRHRGGWTPANRKHRAMQTLDFFDRKLK